MNEAYVFIAIGKKYINEVRTLLKSIRLWDLQRKSVLVTDNNDDDNNMFDKVINIKNNINKYESKTNHDKYCVIARIITPDLIDYDEFMMIDSDILCMSDPNIAWNMFKKTKNCFACVGGRDGSKWHWNNIDSINNKNNMNMQPMHGGLIYFNRKHCDFKTFTANLIYALKNYDKLGFKRLFREISMTDEILFSYAMDKLDIKPLDYIKNPLISFCLTDKIELPPKKITWSQNDIENTTIPCVFNHFTGLHDNTIRNDIYDKWINKVNNEYIYSNNNITCITALIDINRENEGDGRSIDNYLKWFKNTLKINLPFVIYCEKDIYEKIKYWREKYPMTRYKIISKNDIYYLKYSKKVNDIIKSIDYLNKIHGKERLEIKLPKYNLIIANKIEWMKEVSQENYYNSKYFMWVDAGMSRFFNNEDILSKNLINISKITDNKFNIQVSPKLLSTKFKNDNIDNIMYHDIHYTTATIFSTTKSILEIITKKYKEIFDYMLNNNCINNEQIIYALIYKSNPELFNVYVNKQPKHLSYFEYLTK